MKNLIFLIVLALAVPACAGDLTSTGLIDGCYWVSDGGNYRVVCDDGSGYHISDIIKALEISLRYLWPDGFTIADLEYMLNAPKGGKMPTVSDEQAERIKDMIFIKKTLNELKEN